MSRKKLFSWFTRSFQKLYFYFNNTDALLHSIVSTYPTPMMRLDEKGRVTYANQLLVNQFKRPLKQMLGKRIVDLNLVNPYGFNYERIDEAINEVITSLKPVIYEQWTKNIDEQRCFEIKHIPEFNKAGKLVGILGFSQDITINARLRNLAKFLAKVGGTNNTDIYTEIVHYLVDILSFDYVILQTLNESQTTLSIKASAGLTSKISYPFSGSACERSLSLNVLGYAGTMQTENPDDILLAQLKATSGATVPLKSSEGILLGFLSLLNVKKIPHTRGKTMRELVNLVADRLVIALTHERLEVIDANLKEDFRMLVENSPDFISRFNINGKPVYLNPTLRNAGYSIKDDIESNMTPQEQQIFDRVKTVIETGEELQFIDKITTGKNNKTEYMDVRISPERGIHGEVNGAIIVGRNITERIELENKLRKQASIDTLTQLPNRRLFFDSLKGEIAKAKRKNKKLALLFIDLDRFKEINDTLGHDAGDVLLKEASLRIKNTIRESDTVARLGGDEFVVLLSPIEQPMDVGKIAASIIRLLSQPYLFEGTEIFLTASIGISIYPSDTKKGSKLITYADQAMYSAKEMGRNTYRFFTPAMQIEANVRVNMVNDLRNALQKNELQVFYQPILDLHTNKVVKAEALLRWFHPLRGIVPPDEFIKLAEETGLIDDIGDWVFKQSTNMVAMWQTKTKLPVQVSINVSPHQFNQENLVDSWLGVLKDINVSPNSVCLELTENLLLENQQGLHQKLAQLRQSGVQLAIDDFGTGYSAMSYLTKFKIDFIKIDGSFIKDMHKGETTCAIAETIILMASKLGMKSMGECVETLEQKQLLTSFGCDYLQGYLHAKPMPLKDFFNFIEKTS